MDGSLREKMDLVEHFDEDDQATKDAPPVNYVIVTNQIPAVFVSSIRRCAKNFQSKYNFIASGKGESKTFKGSRFIRRRSFYI